MSRITTLRRRAGGAAIEAFFHGISRTAQMHPRARAAQRDVEILRDLNYGDGSPHHSLDIYRPRTPSPDGALRPAVLYIHGGGFRILSKDTHWLMGVAFARRGYVVFNVNYRLAPEHPFPAAIQDSCDAYTWVLEHAEAYGADPRRLVVSGESAGANLTSAVAIATSYERPEPWAQHVFQSGIQPTAAIPACGILQVSDVERFSRRYPHMKRFVADRLDEVERAYLQGAEPHPEGGTELADPLLLLERGERPARPLPPFFVPCGTRDPLIHDSRRLERALKDLEVPVQARYYPGEVHAFHAFIWRPQARACWRHTFAFLDAHTPA